ncbi:hypothetical protein R3W88_025791 [Solanum pinnatisectum]|uniref:Rad60/SUMO-like domain-containing protein n=1 Tax=Solanum pinnatisectum TaxID=50273 RepID=A0AAV9M429_9SOLN|nr:hypothetical protein R3W88_025791 [Solanum pinnatisectum]
MSESKTQIGEETTKFDIHVLSQDESIIVLRMSPNMIMEKLFKSYCKKKQIIDYKTVQFLFDGQHISPKMTIDKDGSITLLSVSLDMVMKRVFLTYCREKLIDWKTVRFVLDGKRISPAKTIDELGLKDGDKIDAMLSSAMSGTQVIIQQGWKLTVFLECTEKVQEIGY